MGKLSYGASLLENEYESVELQGLKYVEHLAAPCHIVAYLLDFTPDTIIRVLATKAPPETLVPAEALGLGGDSWLVLGMKSEA